jgi:hypothetical protein
MQLRRGEGAASRVVRGEGLGKGGIQQFPLITCGSYVTTVSDSALSILIIRFCLLKRLSRADIPGELMASRLIS